MSKNIPAGLRAHYKLGTTKLTKCMRFRRKNGSEFYFTALDRDLLYAGRVYQSAAGLWASASQGSEGLSIDNLEVRGFLRSAYVTETDVLAGLWDFARWWLFELCWEDTTLGINKMRSGWIGQISKHRNMFVAQLDGLAKGYSRQAIQQYQPGCRNLLGDARCGVDLSLWTVSAAVQTVTSKRVFTTNLPAQTVRLTQTPVTTGTPPDNYFGLIRFTSGANAGVEREVKTYTASTGAVELHFATPFPFTAADTIEGVARCGYDRPTCRDRFDNMPAYNGEPDLPGTTQLYKIAKNE